MMEAIDGWVRTAELARELHLRPDQVREKVVAMGLMRKKVKGIKGCDGKVRSAQMMIREDDIKKVMNELGVPGRAPMPKAQRLVLSEAALARRGRARLPQFAKEWSRAIPPAVSEEDRKAVYAGLLQIAIALGAATVMIDVVNKKVRTTRLTQEVYDG